MKSKQITPVDTARELSTPPKWVPAIEDTANSMFEAAQEMLLVIGDCLVRYHGWDDKQLKELAHQTQDVLTGVKEFEKDGLSMLSIHSVDIVGELVEKKGIAGLLSEIAEKRREKNRLDRTGLEHPILAGAKPFLNLLKKKNK